MAKFKTRVDEAIAAKRTIVERQQQLARLELHRSESGDDDDEDEIFVLDPSLLTVQDFQFRVIIPNISLTVCAVYVTQPPPQPQHGNNRAPTSKQAHHQSGVTMNKTATGSVQVMNHSSPSPIFAVEIKLLEAQLNANNNPWSVRVRVSIGRLRLLNLEPIKQKLDTSAKASGRGSREPIISLPNIHGFLNITQSSTVGKGIDGSLDITVRIHHSHCPHATQCKVIHYFKF